MSERLPASAILLAAGQGTRMGGGKLLLPLGEATVIERSVQGFINAGMSEVIVVVGNYALAVQHTLRNYPVRFAFNPDPQSEMMDSIRYGLQILEPHRFAAFLISPADMPLIQPETIRQVTIALLQSDKLIAVPTHHSRRGHPVAFHQQLYETVLTFQSHQGIRQLVHGQPESVLLVEVDDEGITTDIDSWDDYRRALQLWAKRCGIVDNRHPTFVGAE